MTRPKAIRPMGQEEKHHRVMIYGEPGAGKTVFAASGARTLIVSNDSGETISAAAMGSTADVWLAPTYEDIDEVFEYLRHDGCEEYDWVWIDNITLLQDQAMDNLMEQLVAEKPHRNRWVPDQHEYLVNQSRLSTMVRNFKKLPMNVGFTAHVMKTEDNDGKVLYLPMIQGGQGTLSQKVCGYMNIVGYLQTYRKEEETHRRLILEKQGKFLAKGRYPGMSGRLENPTVPELEKAMAASLVSAGSTPRRRRTTTTTTTKRKAV